MVELSPQQESFQSFLYGVPWLTKEEVNGLADACILIGQEGKASTSLLQSKLRFGYGRAERIIRILESAQIIGPEEDGANSKKLLFAQDVIGSLAPIAYSLAETRQAALEVPEILPASVAAVGDEVDEGTTPSSLGAGTGTNRQERKEANPNANDGLLSKLAKPFVAFAQMYKADTKDRITPETGFFKNNLWTRPTALLTATGESAAKLTGMAVNNLIVKPAKWTIKEIDKKGHTQTAKRWGFISAVGATALISFFKGDAAAVAEADASIGSKKPTADLVADAQNAQKVAEAKLATSQSNLTAVTTALANERAEHEVKVEVASKTSWAEGVKKGSSKAVGELQIEASNAAAEIDADKDGKVSTDEKANFLKALLSAGDKALESAGKMEFRR